MKVFKKFPRIIAFAGLVVAAVTENVGIAIGGKTNDKRKIVNWRNDT